MRIPVVAIVGRPNVGKSTLFNRIIGKMRAIVEDMPGVTRDRNYSMVRGYQFPFVLVDTGGFEKDPSDEIAQAVVEQTVIAVEGADLVLAVFDGAAGLSPGDDDVVHMLRQANVPVIYLVNKCDGLEHQPKVLDFYALGIDSLEDVSALHGRRVREVMEGALTLLPDYDQLCHQESIEEEEVELAADEATQELSEGNFLETPDEEEVEIIDEDEEEPEFAPVVVPSDTDEEKDYDRTFGLRALDEIEEQEEEQFPEEDAQEEEIRVEQIRVAIVGKPNAGKSTLLNALLGEKRAIVSPIAGTTRDSLDAELEHEDQKFVLVDTAGLRKKSKVMDALEKYSVMRALNSMSSADVAVLVIDAVEGPTEQDTKIAGLAHESGRGIVFAINKWDLVEKNHRTVQEYKERMKDAFKFAPYAPVVFLCAQTGRRVQTLLEVVKAVALARHKRLSTGRLQRSLARHLRRVSAPQYRGRPVKLYFANQVSVAPPKFLLSFNQPKGVHFSYLRMIKNAIRESYPFEGTDIKLVLRKH